MTRDLLLHVSGHQHERTVCSLGELSTVLRSTDRMGGGEFWLSMPGREFPSLAIRTSGDASDVHYFPSEGHPGYRRRSSRPDQPELKFQFEGCDPGAGELVPGAFIVSTAEAVVVAEHFRVHGSMLEVSKWLEL